MKIGGLNEKNLTRVTRYLWLMVKTPSTRMAVLEEIFLAALPIGAGWTVVGPFVQNDLERFLCVLPAAACVELVGLVERGECAGPLVWRAINTSSPRGGQ